MSQNKKYINETADNTTDNTLYQLSSKQEIPLHANTLPIHRKRYDKANMKMYLEKENEDKPEHIAVMKVIYNGHIYVITSFLQDLQDGLKEMFL